MELARIGTLRCGIAVSTAESTKGQTYMRYSLATTDQPSQTTRCKGSPQKLYWDSYTTNLPMTKSRMCCGKFTLNYPHNLI